MWSLPSRSFKVNCNTQIEVSSNLKQGKHSARKPPKLIILQMCNKITEPNSFRDLKPLKYGLIRPEMGTLTTQN